MSHGQVQEGSELVRLVAASDARVTLLFGLAGSTSGTFVHVGLKQSHKIRLDRSLFHLSQCHTCRVSVGGCCLVCGAWVSQASRVRRATTRYGTSGRSLQLTVTRSVWTRSPSGQLFTLTRYLRKNPGRGKMDTRILREACHSQQRRRRRRRRRRRPRWPRRRRRQRPNGACTY